MARTRNRSLETFAGLGLALTVAFGPSPAARAADLQVNDSAPTFKAKNQAGQDFDLATRRGKWTVLYFYPKAETPGCIKEACTFRDNIAKIRKEGAEVYGISADTVADQAKFHEHHHLNFDLLADPEDQVVDLYGVKMPVVKYAKRWTFILDPELRIKQISKDVDPVIDSEKVATQIAALKSEKK